MSLPGCNGLLLPWVELVLDDLEDLLLVGRLLLPVKPITGGSTVAGGTYVNNQGRNGCLQCAVCYMMFIATDVTKVSHLSQLGEETIYFVLLARVEGLNLTHVPGGGKRE